MGALRLLRGAFALVLGLKLYLVTTPDGMPVAWCLADPKIGEREVAASLLACAARAWHNWATGASDKRSLIAYDH